MEQLLSLRWDIVPEAFIKIGSRYFLAASVAFLIFYILFKQKLSYKKIQKRFPKVPDYLREAGYSLITMLIFSVLIMVLNSSPIAEHTTRYQNISDYGWGYYFLAFPIMFVLHDFYFYWVHRLMHHKTLFKYVHLVHHRSTNPSPWAAYVTGT